jgi:hypothetical protein
MRRILLLFLGLLLITCSQKTENKEQNKTGLASQVKANVHKVIVERKTDASVYSYLYVSENGKKYWMATRKMTVKPGDVVYYSQGMLMKDFHSNTLNKTFKEILFVQDATTDSAEFGVKEMLKMAHYGVQKEKKEKIKVTQAKDGKTVAEIYKDKNELAGKIVRVRGKVVKFNPNIMGRNWIHIQDGTEYQGKYDLLITSQQFVKVGDVKTFEGIVVPGKDFGAGYVYEVLLESGKVVE